MFNRSVARIAALAGASLAAGAASQHAGLADALARKDEASGGRIYGDANIRRMVRQYAFKQRDWAKRGRTSIADKPHLHRRAIARRTTKPGTPERRAAMEASRHAA